MARWKDEKGVMGERMVNGRIKAGRREEHRQKLAPRECEVPEGSRDRGDEHRLMSSEKSGFAGRGSADIKRGVHWFEKLSWRHINPRQMP